MQLLTNNLNSMKYRIFMLFLVAVSLSSSCADPEEETTSIGNWTKTTPFKGRPRSGAISFTIGSKAFVGLGYDGDEYITDFYSYDINTGYWENKKTFPGTARERAVAFSINGRGYIGLGYNRELTKEELGDFWEYNPDSDTWTQVESFAGTARYNAVAFAIGSKAYIGTGYDGDKYNSDFWEFDPTSTPMWHEIRSYPGEKIEGGLAFVIDGKGYVCTGRNNGSYNTGFWRFDPNDAGWTKLTPDSDDDDYYDEFKVGVFRHDAVALVIGPYAYIVGGVASSGATDRSVYQYNSQTGEWDDRTSFEGSARSLAVGYVLGEQAFVGTGQNGTSRYDDLWEFKHLEEYDEDN